MNTLEEMISKVSIRHSNLISKFSEPLLNHFGVNNFTYSKINDSGQFYCICSNISWMEYYFSEKLYLSQPHWRHPKNFQSSISLPKLVKCEKYQEIREKAYSKFNVNFSVVILNKVVDGIEFIGLDVNTPCSSHDILIVNEVSLIRKIVNNFVVENKALLTEAEEYQVDFNQLIGNKFQSADVVVTANLPNKKQFLKELGIKVPETLTLKDKEILLQLLEGKSAIQIAQCMYLSCRTIEHRIEKLKNKLSCFSKFELIQKARELEVIGYL